MHFPLLRPHTLALVIGLAFAASVSAQTVHVMFKVENHTFQGISPVPGSTASDYWNVVGVDYDYFLPQSAVSLAYSDDGKGFIGYTEITDNDPTALYLGGLDGNDLPVFDAYAHAGGNRMNFTINNLTPNSSYDLYVYMGRNTNHWLLETPGQVESGSVTVGAATQTVNYQFAQTSYAQGVNYVLFSSLLSNPDGEITFSTSNIVNGFSIATAIPEPSTYAALAGLLVFGLVAMRHRRRAA
ncbi:MAG: PEP-CTERM sorting domain-containing protein [Candidatus Didemnitutus sp.]|nr:PEP-CTERM sorting domain-containing protein [Candidatus Didemnitutus sp.]